MNTKMSLNDFLLKNVIQIESSMHEILRDEGEAETTTETEAASCPYVAPHSIYMNVSI